MRLFFFKDGNPNFRHCTLTCHHQLNTSHNITVDSIIIASNCYTHPLIAPDLPLNHLGAISYNSKEYALKHDPEFSQACHVATVQADIDHQETHFAMLEKALVPEPSCLKKSTIKKLIIQAIPIYKICAYTEWIF